MRSIGMSAERRGARDFAALSLFLRLGAAFVLPDSAGLLRVIASTTADSRRFNTSRPGELAVRTFFATRFASVFAAFAVFRAAFGTAFLARDFPFPLFCF